MKTANYKTSSIVSMSLSSRTRQFAFTLVEVLVVLFIFLLLAAIALPTVKNLLVDQKISRAARSIVGYLDQVRSRAIAERREMGVLIERYSNDPADQQLCAYSIRLRQLTSLPPYCGDSLDARAELLDLDPAVPGVDTAEFSLADNQLLGVSLSLLNDADITNDSLAPIQANRDRLELPGGKVVTIKTVKYNSGDSTLGQLVFDMRFEQKLSTSFEYPLGSKPVLSPSQRVRYRILRAPVVSSTLPLVFPRGIAIDFNYSGIGIDGQQFRGPVTAGQPTVNSIRLIFGPDGRVSFVNDEFATSGVSESLFTPTGSIYLCVGEIDGVKDQSSLFELKRGEVANILNPRSAWVVVNHITGRAFASTMSEVTEGTLAMAETTGAEVRSKVALSLRQSRQLASFSDALEL